MKKIKTKVLGLAVIALTMMISCNNSSTNSTKKTSWTDDEKKEYMQGCISSARAKYEQQGQEPNKELVIKLCACLGQDMEANYNYDEANKLSDEDVKAHVMEATKKCLPKDSQ